MNHDRICSLEQMLSLVPLLAKVWKPLAATSPITLYGYSEYRRNGTVVRIVSDSGWFERYVEASIPVLGNGSWINMEPFTSRHRRAGFALWDLETRSQANDRPDRLELELESAGLGHVCSFVEKPDDALVKIHHFVGRFEDATANSFHLNNTNLLKCFSRYISKELTPAIQKTRPFCLNPDKLEAYQAWMDNIGESNRISIPRFLVEYAPHATLSKRQKELLYWSVVGKTREEIAIILGLKKSTVKKYFERLKAKFKCSSKNEVIAELLRNGVCFKDIRESEFY